MSIFLLIWLLECILQLPKSDIFSGFNITFHTEKQISKNVIIIISCVRYFNYLVIKNNKLNREKKVC
jgi:hypothetical protein